MDRHTSRMVRDSVIQAAPRQGRRTVAALTIFFVAVVGLWAPAADALSTSEDPPATDGALRCLENVNGSVSGTPSTLVVGQTATVSWTVRLPSGCPSTNFRYSFNGAMVGRTGTRTVQPIAGITPTWDGRWLTTYSVHVYYSGYGPRQIGGFSIDVRLPQDPANPDRFLVSITGNHQAPLLVQGLATPNTTVLVANHVELDLSYRHNIAIADGVVLQGGRGGLSPGPRLYTTTRPIYKVMFYVLGRRGPTVAVDPAVPPVRVRVSGVRIEGPDMGSVDGDSDTLTNGIRVNTCDEMGAAPLIVEIDHNEIYGWNGAAIRVMDECNRLDPPSSSVTFKTRAVRIHDNYIHHNQHTGGDGYGVTVTEGAYALIDRNVFDWNRHAIEGDGSPDAGYEAYRNLVLPNGGLHRWFGYWIHTHQFDMHGTANCGVESVFSDSQWNCGLAGYSMYIRENTFLYDADNAIKLRGTPQLGMYVGANVFRHDSPYDAMSQTETGLYIEYANGVDTNRYGIDGSTQLGSCDFDGDGINDAFMATGVTLWYSSGHTMPWAYLNASTARLADITLADFDGDGRCDVLVGGLLSSGGTGPFRPWFRAPLPSPGMLLP